MIRTGNKQCLVICPFGEVDSKIRERSDFMIDSIIKPVMEKEGYNAYRYIDLNRPGEITAQAIRELYEADLTIADLTYQKPNVFYELALRLSVAKPTILMSDDLANIPFYIVSLNIIKIEKDLHNLNSKEIQRIKKELRYQTQQIKSGKAIFETAASLWHPLRQESWKFIDKPRNFLIKNNIPIRAYVWEVEYTHTLSQDWLNLQDDDLRKYIDIFIREGKLPDNPLHKNLLAEYFEYRNVQGKYLKGDLYYIIDNKNITFTGWANFIFSETSGPLAIMIKGEDRSKNREENVIIYFAQPSRQVRLNEKFSTEIHSFNYSIDFERDQATNHFVGKLYHPDFNGDKLLVAYTRLIPKFEINL